MLLGKNHRHTGMDLCDEFIRLACDNRAGVQPILQSQDLANPRLISHRQKSVRFLCWRELSDLHIIYEVYA
jgi:hypothetical protein